MSEDKNMEMPIGYEEPSDNIPDGFGLEEAMRWWDVAELALGFGADFQQFPCPDCGSSSDWQKMAVDHWVLICDCGYREHLTGD